VAAHAGQHAELAGQVDGIGQADGSGWWKWPWMRMAAMILLTAKKTPASAQSIRQTWRELVRYRRPMLAAMIVQLASAAATTSVNASILFP
jgi:hypothetical protein